MCSPSFGNLTISNLDYETFASFGWQKSRVGLGIFFWGELFAQFRLGLFGDLALHHPSLWVATKHGKI